MINGVMTLSGAWHKLRDDPILRFPVSYTHLTLPTSDLV